MPVPATPQFSMVTTNAPFATLFDATFRRPDEIVAGTIAPGSIVAFGAPLQSASPRRAGAEDGPAAVRESSCNLLQAYLASPSHTAVDFEAGTAWRLRESETISDLGDLDCGGQIVAGDIARIAQVTTRIVTAGGLPVLLGGDHRVFEGLVAGLGERQPAMLVISDKLTLPATIDGAALPIAALASATARDEGTCPVLCVGINGLQPGHAWDALEHIGGRIVSADELHDSPRQAFTTIQSFLEEHAELICCIDLEVVDAGHAAGTPAINVGGLTPEQLTDLLASMDISDKLAGLALTNVAPRRDVRGLSELAAAESLLASVRRRMFDEVAS